MGLSGQHTIGFWVSRAAVGLRAQGLGCCDAHWASMKLKAHQLSVGRYIWSVYVYVNIDVYEDMFADANEHVHLHACIFIYSCVHLIFVFYVCIYII